jgi:ubiquinone/menaquinone biosynthesis C-methylase UbiE
MNTSIRHGDFTGLAEDYSKNRPDYNNSIARAIVTLVDKGIDKIVCADVGAGTGIFSRMLWQLNVGKVYAIEPNDDMREAGKRDSSATSIEWQKGCAESLGLKDSSLDLLTMASCFHWATFDDATEEIARVLKPGGRFTALWNPRIIENNPLLIEIQEFLDELHPNITRVSSGMSGITDSLAERLESTKLFNDVIYLEGTHSIKMSVERYIGAWRSVNDLRAQLGHHKFEKFLDYVTARTKSLEYIEAKYLTRAWSARSC